MADIKRIWISKTSRWNAETKTVESFYRADVEVEGKDGVSINLDITGDALNKVYKAVKPSIKKALLANIKDLPDEL